MPLKMSTSRCCNRLTRCKCTGSRFWSTRIEACHCEPVLTLAWQSPQVSENLRRSAKAPLADQGWCSAQRIKIEMIASGNHTIIRAAPVRTLGLRGSELTRFDNPSVMALRETAMTAPFTQGSRWVLPHQCVYRCFSEKPEKCTTFLYHIHWFAMTSVILRFLFSAVGQQ